MSYTIRATTDFAFDVTAQTDDRELANTIFAGLVLTNVYAQVEVEDSTHTVVKATYPIAADHRPTGDRCTCGGNIVYFEDGDDNGQRGEGCEVANLVFDRQPRRNVR